MGKAPAVIIIVRHGARLDAENKSWHLTSPTPYDPPLSYGGWTQTRALGARIASLLHARGVALTDDEGVEAPELASDPSSTSGTGELGSKSKVKRRKNRIMIHTSPFIRCIQSSIGISAGMAQFEGNRAHSDSQDQPGSSSSKLFNNSSRLNTSTLEPRNTSNTGTKTPPTSQPLEEPSNLTKPVLRVDACLGEWLTPDYYENMTTPPASHMMIAGAKADLRRIAPVIKGSHLHEDHSTIKLHSTDRRNHESTVTFAMDKSPRSSSKRRNVQTSSIQKYTPPTPNYAVSPSEGIPDGYVANARDACVEIDFWWDSSRSPQHWGDGGQFGEEWSSMHNRFRKGLMDMITWYKENGHQQGLKSTSEDSVESHVQKDNDEDTDLVLIIVTHSAGCNALIGALTNQPVLIDVGMASLTMAYHRPSNPSSALSARPRLERRQSVVDCSQSDDYEMKMVASTDHLRAGSDVLKIPLLQSSSTMAPTLEQGRQRGASLSVVTLSTDLDRPRSKNSALGSIRRIRPTPTTPSTKFPSTLDNASPTGAAGGLWGGRRTSLQATQEIEVDPLTHVSDSSEPPTTVATERSGNYIADVGPAERPPSPVRPSQESIDRRGSRGLWGSASVAPEQHKRRWTVSDRS